MPSPFTHIATYRGVGGVLNALAGPGPDGPNGPQRLYQSHIYIGSTLELVSIDPETGEHEVYPSPVPTESGAWAMAPGPAADGCLYLGTLPNAHVLRFDPRARTLTDAGRPSETEQYIWQLALGTDGRLYGCTYPSCKLVRYDPATGRGEDLGRLDPHEQYARHIAASDNGFIYIGIGTSTAHLVAYGIATGERRDVLPEPQRVTGTATVHRGDDGRVYASAAGQHFRLHRWTAIPIDASEVRPDPRTRLRDGRTAAVEDGQVILSAPDGARLSAVPFTYPGKEIDVFRLALGPDGNLYGSTILPLRFFRVLVESEDRSRRSGSLPPGGGATSVILSEAKDPSPSANALTELGRLGGGEFYSFLTLGKHLLAAAYAGDAPLMVYDPSEPFAPGPHVIIYRHRKAPFPNPLLIEYPDQVTSWRPMAMISGPPSEDGQPSTTVYLGAVAGYGELGGPLTVWDTATHHVESYPHLIPDQSVISLALLDTPDGPLLVGGTAIRGGGGSHPTQTDAALFLWDPRTRELLFHIVPVPGAAEITDLVAVPGTADRPAGLVYGIAGGHTLFAFDPGRREVVRTEELPFSGVVYNAAALGPDGRIWGLANDGIFTIDPATAHTQLVARSEERITAGFALDPAGRSLYFASGARIYRYALPELHR